MLLITKAEHAVSLTYTELYRVANSGADVGFQIQLSIV